MEGEGERRKSEKVERELGDVLRTERTRPKESTNEEGLPRSLNGMSVR